MSNLLQAAISLFELDEVETMNKLQDHGLISDNAISAADVPDCDARRAVEILEP
jgi:hypothetical protein